MMPQQCFWIALSALLLCVTAVVAEKASVLASEDSHENARGLLSSAWFPIRDSTPSFLNLFASSSSSAANLADQVVEVKSEPSMNIPFFGDTARGLKPRRRPPTGRPGCPFCSSILAPSPQPNKGKGKSKGKESKDPKDPKDLNQSKDSKQSKTDSLPMEGNSKTISDPTVSYVTNTNAEAPHSLLAFFLSNIWLCAFLLGGLVVGGCYAIRGRPRDGYEPLE